MQSNKLTGDLNPVSIKTSHSTALRMGVMAFLITILTLVTGCASVKKEVETITVTKTEYVHSEVPRVYTNPVFVPAPPDQKEYIEGTQGKTEIEILRKRNEMLTEYILKLLPVFKDVNTDRKSLRKWSDDQANKKKQAEKKQDLLGDMLTEKAQKDKDKEGVK